MLAAIGVVLKTTTGDAEVDGLQAALAARVDAESRKRLTAAVGRLTSRGGTADVLGWVRSVERTACRAGLLACGDVTVAARILAVDPRAVGGLGASDRIRDLLAFSVSTPYAEVRRALGIAVAGPIPKAAEPTDLEVAVDVGLDL